MTGIKAQIGPSVLNADLSDLAGQSQLLLDQGADYLHLDVMDGNFVPNLSFGHSVVACLRKKIVGAIFDVHMMVTRPEQWVEEMAKAGADNYTFHIEATESPEDLCQKIRKNGMKPGVALKPGTSVDTVMKLVDASLVDIVLIMTVEPGFGGQKFMGDMMTKVRTLREKYPSLDIEVDGGVGPGTIDQCASAGANMIVSGTAVVKSEDPRSVMNNMRDVVQKYL